MCGLAGIILEKQDRSKKDIDIIKSSFRDMLIEADTRGGHATGFAILDRQGGYLIYKRPVDAWRFFGSKDAYDVLDITYNNVTCIMGHTRYATKGKPSINKNNHPIRAGNTIGTHNGSIHNHKELFRRYGMSRYAQVDSEAIFRLYETSQGAKDFADNRLPDVRGRVAIVWADLEFPEYIYAVKANNPLKLVYVPSLRVFAYGSTMDIINAGFSNNYKHIDIDKNTMIRINTRTSRIRRKSIQITEPIQSNYYYDSKIGAYIKKSSHTVRNFVPRYSYSDLKQQNLFKKYKALDGSTIKKVSK